MKTPGHKTPAKDRDATPALPRPRPQPSAPEPHGLTTSTAVVAEALRTGVFPLRVAPYTEEIPREDRAMQVGDPDDDALENEYVGENLPGGDTPTPDQNQVDEIGRAYGLEEEDAGALRSAAEILERRDRRRFELRAPRRPQV